MEYQILQQKLFPLNLRALSSCCRANFFTAAFCRPTEKAE